MGVQLPLVSVLVAAASVFSVQAVSGAVAGPLVCGGVGAEDRAALAARADGANLAVEFIVADRGNYLADVDLAIVPLDRRSQALTTTADGPLCYVSVPPGRYRIEATFNGTTRTVATRVPAAGRAPVHVALAFPASVVPGDLDTRPSPEEQQEAKTP